jgi:hypothetical protein
VSNQIDTEVSIEDTKAILERKITQTTEKLSKLIKTKQKEVYVNGVNVPLDQGLFNPYCYLVKVANRIEIVEDDTSTGNTDSTGDLGNSGLDGGIIDIDFGDLDIENYPIETPLEPQILKNKQIVKSSIIFMINLGSTSAQIVSQTHHINTNEVDSSATELMANDGNGIVTLRLFTDATLQFTGNSVNVSGQLTLNNGKVLNYAVDVDLTTKIAHGCIDMSSDNPTHPDVNLYGIGKIGVADFRKVEQTVCCYVAGEVSHIENVLAKEFKKRETRSLLSSEVTTETTSEKEVENLTDTTTTERNELQSEVSNVLNEDESSNYGASAGVSGGKGDLFRFSADAHADFANSTSSSQSNSQAQTYAQDITERALNRVVTKTSKKQTSRVLKEFEENNQHGFDNREGTEHVSGVYRWIDIIYKNQLINYGKRLMYEFMVPEPARFYHTASLVKGESSSGNTGDFVVVEKPIHPSELDHILAIQNAKGLNETNYLQLASIYNAEINAMPLLYKHVNKAYGYWADKDGEDSSHDFAGTLDNIEIPKGYFALNGQINGEFYRGSGRDHYFDVVVGNVKKRLFANTDINQSLTFNKIENDIEVSMQSDGLATSAFNITVKCQRTNELFYQWQIDTYNTILEAYEVQVQNYNDYIAAQGLDEQFNEDDKQLRFSNAFNRILEKRELKRICIEMLVKPYNNPLGQDNYVLDDNVVPRVKQDAAFENHAAHVKFFEQAFDWDIMAYLFYSYYWANEAKWEKLFQKTNNTDPIFQAFLQSGMARVVVPIRPGFEDAVTYYMETGDIWKGGDLVIDQDNDLYISIAEEMQSLGGSVEKTWETRMPTSLTIVQKGTLGLDETGLPCCDAVGLPTENTIKDKPNVSLSGTSNTTTTP